MFKWLLIFMLLASPCLADTVQVDVSSWTQDQKNMTKAMVSKLLFDNSITHNGINVNLPNIEVINPSQPIILLTAQFIVNEYTAWKVTMDENIVVAQAMEFAKEQEVQNSELKNLTLSDIDSWIDSQVNSINNLVDAKLFLKSFLKKLVRYLKAKNI